MDDCLVLGHCHWGFPSVSLLFPLSNYFEICTLFCLDMGSFFGVDLEIRSIAYSIDVLWDFSPFECKWNIVCPYICLDGLSICFWLAPHAGFVLQFLWYRKLVLAVLTFGD